MSSRPSVPLATVCRALQVGAQRIRAGHQGVRLSAIVQELSHEKPRYCSAAVREAKAEGLICATASGYTLTPKGRALL